MKNTLISQDFPLQLLTIAVFTILHLTEALSPSRLLQSLSLLCDILLQLRILCSMVLPRLNNSSSNCRRLAKCRWVVAISMCLLGLNVDLAALARFLQPLFLGAMCLVCTIQVRPNTSPEFPNYSTHVPEAKEATELEPALRTRRRKLFRSSSSSFGKFKDDWLDSVCESYFVVRDDLTLAYANRRALEVIQEYGVGFTELTHKLTEPEGMHRTLHTLIQALAVDAVVGANTKAVLGWVENETLDDPEHVAKFKGDLFVSYTARLSRLPKGYVLLLLRDKTYGATIVLTDGLSKATSRTLSHDLKTSLNGVLGNLELLEDSIQPECRIYHKVALSCSHMLACKLDGLLDYLQIKNHELKIHYGLFSLAELIQEVVAICEWPAKHKQLQIEVTQDSTLPVTLIGDKARIKQVLIHLLDKAIEFTDYGTIGLSVKAKPRQHVGFKVASMGSGMRDRLLHHVRESSALARRRKYLAAEEDLKAGENIEEMYLEISQLICREMGSKISVKSDKRGYSALRFVIHNSFPLLPTPSLRRKSSRHRQNSLHERAPSPRAILKLPHNSMRHIVRCGNVGSINIINVTLGNSPSPLDQKATLSLFHECCSSMSEMEEQLSDYQSPERVHKYVLEPHLQPAYEPQERSATARTVLLPHCSTFHCVDSKRDGVSTLAHTIRRTFLRASTMKKEKPRRKTSAGLPNSTTKRQSQKNIVDANDKCQVLIVDDNFTNRFVLKSLLKKRGYHSMEACHGQEALLLVERYLNSFVLVVIS